MLRLLLLLLRRLLPVLLLHRLGDAARHMSSSSSRGTGVQKGQTANCRPTLVVKRKTARIGALEVNARNETATVSCKHNMHLETT